MLKEIYYQTLFGKESEVEALISKNINTIGIKEIIPILAYFNKKEWSIKLIELIISQLKDETAEFVLYDELIYYLTYFENKDYLEIFIEKVKNLKLQLEITTSILEKNLKKGEELVKKFLESDDLSQISVGVFLVSNFRLKNFKQTLIRLMNDRILEDIKYQILFTLGIIEEEKYLPVLLKGATIKTDKQMDYLDSLKNFNKEEVTLRLKKEASKFFGDKIIKLKIAEILYKKDKDFSNKIFAKYLKSSKLDVQGYTLDIISGLKNDFFINDVEKIFNQKGHFHLPFAINYFKAINHTKTIDEIKKCYGINKKTVKQEVVKAISVMETDVEKQKAFYSELIDDDKILFLKNIIDIKLKRKK